MAFAAGQVKERIDIMQFSEITQVQQRSVKFLKLPKSSDINR